MQTEEKIKKALKYLEEQRHPSPNMGYERQGAIDALRWVLGDSDEIPMHIGTR